MGNVSVLQTTTANMSLLDSIKTANKKGIPTDGFLNGVFQSVQASDDNFKFFRIFFMDKNEVLSYRRARDVWAKICVPADWQEAVLRTAHDSDDNVMASRPGIDCTYSAVPDVYYWPACLQTCQKYCRGCDSV